jgi:hypothetical protein
MSGSASVQGSASRGTHEINNDGSEAKLLRTRKQYNWFGHGYFYNGTGYGLFRIPEYRRSARCKINDLSNDLHNSTGLKENRRKLVIARFRGHHHVHCRRSAMDHRRMIDRLTCPTGSGRPTHALCGDWRNHNKARCSRSPCRQRRGPLEEDN